MKYMYVYRPISTAVLLRRAIFARHSTSGRNPSERWQRVLQNIEDARAGLTNMQQSL